VSELTTVKYPQYMYIQNDLFRKHAFGNLIVFVKAVNIDPAMLKYLDGRLNKRQKPNENYARELLELFTMGIGNYTETDIAEAARALTGWRLDGLGSKFVLSRFDSGEKTFLGQKGNFSHNDIVDIIFQQDATAKWFCSKLYKEFIHYEINQVYVDELAALLRASNYQIKPVLSALLKSQYFHSIDIRGAAIKSPVHFLLSSLKQFSIARPDYNYIRLVSADLQQELFDPPDVRGWEGQRKWISTNTYPVRNRYTDGIVDGKKYNGKNLSFQVDVLAYARSYSSSEDAVRFVADVCRQLIQFPLSDKRKEFLLGTLLDGADPYDWSTHSDQAESRLQKFFKALMQLPEYQLS
jgi:uncharacterized protein (DUF1800 family)